MSEVGEYKVLQQFRDIYTKKEYTKGQVIEMTEKRANEAISNLKDYDGKFLERIDNKKQEEGK